MKTIAVMSGIENQSEHELNFKKYY